MMIDEQMVIMDGLKQVAGSDMFNDAWNWIFDQLDRYQSHDWSEIDVAKGC